MAREHRDPGRKPTIAVSGSAPEDAAPTSERGFKMVGTVRPPEPTEEEKAAPMPAPTKPLITSSPS